MMAFILVIILVQVIQRLGLVFSIPWTHHYRRTSVPGVCTPPSPCLPGGRIGTPIQVIDDRVYLYGGYGYGYHAEPYPKALDGMYWKDVSSAVSTFTNEIGPPTMWWVTPPAVPRTDDHSSIYPHSWSMVYDPENTPGSRYWHAMVVYQDTLVIVGGYDEMCLLPNKFNDMWQYRPTTNEFRQFYLAGNGHYYDDCFFINKPSYTTGKGIYSTGHIFGGRSSVAVATDDSSIWFFGGHGFGTAPGVAGRLNDMWRYCPACAPGPAPGMAWITGSSIADPPGGGVVFGVKGQYESYHTPGARSAAMAFMHGTKILIFGGQATSAGYNDVWGFETTTNKWAWIGGANIPNVPPVYGTPGIFADANHPIPARGNGAFKIGNSVYLYGGLDASFVAGMFSGELWEFGITQGTHGQYRHVFGTMDQARSTPNIPGLSHQSYGSTHTSHGILCIEGAAASGTQLDIWDYEFAIVCDGLGPSDPGVCSDNGICYGPELCNCTIPYAGTYCDEFLECYGYIYNHSLVCYGHGVCVGEDDCDCNPDYIGDVCSTYIGSVWCFGYPADDPLVCSEHGVCEAGGYCNCTDGYSSFDCSVAIECFGVDKDDPAVCSTHGECIDVDTCECDPYYETDDCSRLFQCFGFEMNDTSACSGHGICLAEDVCMCTPPYIPAQCAETWRCYTVPAIHPDVCSGNGTCGAPEVCTCTPPYIGGGCSTLPNGTLECFGIFAGNDSVCAGHGACMAPGECFCTFPYSGDQCLGGASCAGVAFDDPSVCSGNGDCISQNVCSCDYPYYGGTCYLAHQCGTKLITDPTACSEHGDCLLNGTTGYCDCNPPYHGSDCDLSFGCFGFETSDPDACSGQGICTGEDNCECDTGFIGDICSVEGDGEGGGPAKRGAVSALYGLYVMIPVGICVIIFITVVVVVIVWQVAYFWTRKRKKSAELDSYSELFDQD